MLTTPERKEKKIVNNGDVYCTKKEYKVVCRPDMRKRASMFPKWYCFNCGRYVLPDGKLHWFHVFEISWKEKKKGTHHAQD